MRRVAQCAARLVRMNPFLRSLSRCQGCEGTNSQGEYVAMAQSENIALVDGGFLDVLEKVLGLMGVGERSDQDLLLFESLVCAGFGDERSPFLGVVSFLMSAFQETQA